MNSLSPIVTVLIIKKHPIPYCNCKSDCNSNFYQLMCSKGKSYIYHDTAYQYLLLMYGNPSTWEKSETIQCMNDSDEIEVIQVIPASDTKGKEEKLRKRIKPKIIKKFYSKETDK